MSNKSILTMLTVVVVLLVTVIIAGGVTSYAATPQLTVGYIGPKLTVGLGYSTTLANPNGLMATVAQAQLGMLLPMSSLMGQPLGLRSTHPNPNLFVGFTLSELLKVNVDLPILAGIHINGIRIGPGFGVMGVLDMQGSGIKLHPFLFFLISIPTNINL